MYYNSSVFFGVKKSPASPAKRALAQERGRSGGKVFPRVEWGAPETPWAPARGKAFPLLLTWELPPRESWCLIVQVPLDHFTSALEQVQPMIAEHASASWSQALDGARPAQSRSAQDLTALLLAVNYELLGYSPEHAWLLAQRGEGGTPGDHLDG